MDQGGDNEMNSRSFDGLEMGDKRDVNLEGLRDFWLEQPGEWRTYLLRQKAREDQVGGGWKMESSILNMLSLTFRWKCQESWMHKSGI